MLSIKKVLSVICVMGFMLAVYSYNYDFENLADVNKRKIDSIQQSNQTVYLTLLNDFSVDYVSHAVKKRKKFIIKHGAIAACLERMCMFEVEHVPYEIRNEYSASLEEKNGISYIVFDNVDTKSIFSNQRQLALVRYEITDF